MEDLKYFYAVIHMTICTPYKLLFIGSFFRRAAQISYLSLHYNYQCWHEDVAKLQHFCRNNRSNFSTNSQDQSEFVVL